MGDRQLAQGAVELEERLLAVEEDGLGLQRRSGCRRAAVRLQLLHVLRVPLARQLQRAARAVVGGQVVGERAHERELRDRPAVSGRDRLEHARPLRRLDERDDVVEVIAAPHREHADRRSGAGELARVLLRSVRNQRHVGVVGGQDGRHDGGVPLHTSDDDVASSRRHRRVDRGARRRRHAGRERLQPSLDGRDGIVDRAVHHAAEDAAAGGGTRAGDDRGRGDAAPVQHRVLGRRHGRRRGRPRRPYGQDHDEYECRGEAKTNSHGLLPPIRFMTGLRRR